MKTSWMALALMAASPAFAQTQTKEALYVTSLAATCANCHGTNGRAVADSAVPSLAGMPKDYMVKQLVAFRSGARPATVMHQISKGFNEAQIDQVATYFAQKK